ncbi:TetR/AcrR family transcriptional regulator [Marinobacterium stanieri]|uniref:TetR/AcrR family transcriptional regulator n=1 Tax=Marinobacterium stanieri TaxID=49186 RepID=UPI003A8E329D
MTSARKPASRGRPRTITHERIADAGINIGLPSITFVGVAAALGVSHMALYKHVPSLEALKHLVAEEIFTRWQLPPVSDNNKAGLQAYLIQFTGAVREFVKAHPGLAPYVIRRSAATCPMLTKIDEHQSQVAHQFGLGKGQARWLMATVTFHCIAMADSVYSAIGEELDVETDRSAEEAELEAELVQGMQALIVGALAMLEKAENPTIQP